MRLRRSRCAADPSASSVSALSPAPRSREVAVMTATLAPKSGEPVSGRYRQEPTGQYILAYIGTRTRSTICGMSLAATDEQRAAQAALRTWAAGAQPLTTVRAQEAD